MRIVGRLMAGTAFVAAGWAACVLAGYVLAGPEDGIAYGLCMAIIWTTGTVVTTTTGQM